MFGEIAFAGTGELLVEGFGEDELEDGVAEVFEALVGIGGFGVVLEVGGMGEREAEERGVVEGVQENPRPDD